MNNQNQKTSIVLYSAKFRRKQTEISDFHSVQVIIPSGANCSQVKNLPSDVNAA